jgi:hypothetical protein
MTGDRLRARNRAELDPELMMDVMTHGWIGLRACLLLSDQLAASALHCMDASGACCPVSSPLVISTALPLLLHIFFLVFLL